MGNPRAHEAPKEITSRLGTAKTGTPSVITYTGRWPDLDNGTTKDKSVNCHLLPSDFLRVEGMMSIAKKWWTYGGENYKQQRAEYLTIYKDEATLRNTLWPLPCADITTWD